MTYRVIYGETLPIWEQTFPTLREAMAFARKHESLGDIIFSIIKVSPGQGPLSIMGILMKLKKNQKRNR